MRAALTFWLALAVGGGATVALAAPAPSDALRLHRGLGPDFERPRVRVYPLLDQTALANPRGERSNPAAWDAFVAALAGRTNLAVQDPEATRRSITRRAGYAQALRLARSTAERARDDHRRARLEAALAGLRTAIHALQEIEHHVVAPPEVARLLLLQGQAQLELRDAQGARDSFERALTLAPDVRLQPGTDSPAAVEALEATRHNLAEKPPIPEDHLRVPTGLRSTQHLLRARQVGDVLIVTVQSAGGLREEQQALAGLTAAEAGDRLASRVWACLPFGRAPRRSRHKRELLLDAGFHYQVFANSPVVDLFSNLGIGMNASLTVAPHLSLDANLALTNSNRDPNEDLRQDISTVRVFLGPGFTWSAGFLRGGANLGFEGMTISDVVTTRNVHCKFDPDAHPLCNAAADTSRSGRAWRLGPALALNGQLHLVEGIYLALRISAGLTLYESVDNGLGPPITGQLGLGYAFD
ncbi:MAG: hypothetical protein H6702_19430 [Myxococcales bacterium]|nr:hypothetical protein [Myxococcales bacterium]